MTLWFSYNVLGHVQGRGRGDDRERGEREADLEIGRETEIETEVDAEVVHVPEAGGEAVLEIAGAVDPETEREETTGVDHERESAQALKRGEGHEREIEMEGGSQDHETEGEVAQGREDVLGQGKERGRDRCLGTGSSEGEATLGRRETN